jgi:hypothetical protein
MKISIWQQFSSNHSASYTVIGKFGTAQEAEAAAEALKELLQELIVDYGDWYSRGLVLRGKHIGERFGFDWQEDIDWLHEYYRNRKNPSREIKTFENRVFVGPIGFRIHTWQNGHQFENLLNAFGAKTLRTSTFAYSPDGKDDNATIEFIMHCEAPIEGQATEIFQLLQMHLQNKISQWDWLAFHPDWEQLSKGLSLAEIRREEALYISEAEAWLKHIKQFESVKRESWQAWSKRVQEEHRNLSASFYKQSSEMRETIVRLRAETALQKEYIQLELENQSILIKTHIMATAFVLLRVLMPWLKSKGFTMHYDFYNPGEI